MTTGYNAKLIIEKMREVGFSLPEEHPACPACAGAGTTIAIASGASGTAASGFHMPTMTVPCKWCGGSGKVPEMDPAVVGADILRMVAEKHKVSPSSIVELDFKIPDDHGFNISCGRCAGSTVGAQFIELEFTRYAYAKPGAPADFLTNAWRVGHALCPGCSTLWCVVQGPGDFVSESEKQRRRQIIVAACDAALGES